MSDSKNPIDAAFFDHMMSLPEDDFVVKNAGMLSGIRIWRAAWEAALDHYQPADVRGAVPDAITLHDVGDFIMANSQIERLRFQQGWQECRKAMLATPPQPAGDEHISEQIQLLARHDPIIRRAVEMHRYQNEPWARCMESAAVALSESVMELRGLILKRLQNAPPQDQEGGV